MNGLDTSAILAEIDQVVAKGHGLAVGEPRVIGLRGEPEAAPLGVYQHLVNREPVSVRVVGCVSALAAREALIDHRGAEPAGRSRDWLVIVTDRDETDLGPGIVGHLIGQRLRQVDPWMGVKRGFGATGIDRSLSRLPQDREVARGLLRVLAEDPGPWPAAPAGLLTLDHVATALARRVLGLPEGTLDAVAVLRWAAAGPQPSMKTAPQQRHGDNPLGDAGETSPKPAAASRTAMGALAHLRSRGGDPLVEALLDWLARRCGAAADVVRAELREARPARLVPLGIAAHHLKEARSHDPAASAAWDSFVARQGPGYAKPGVVDALGPVAMTVAGDLLDHVTASGERSAWATGSALLGEADRLLSEVGAGAVAEASVLLPSGLKTRFRDLALALKAASQGVAISRVSEQAGPDPVDAAWWAISHHALVRTAPPRQRPSAYTPSEAAVRLHRWLATRGTADGGLPFADQCRAHVQIDAWVDSAIHDAAGGVADLELSTALAEVVTGARTVRAAEDRVFAAELARIAEIGDGAGGALSGEGDPVLPVEFILRDVVAPLATTNPALFIVLDGMTARVAAEIIEDVRADGRGWVEALPRGVQARMAGLAVLPTLTEHSRTSLLCGRLVSGTQQTEKKEHPAIVTALGAGPGQIFHKADLDRVPDGHRLAHAVRDALGDPTNRLVTCVLNTIDDALDRSDPEGIDWRLDSVKHLAALLEEAADVGRAVVLTSDHGHVLERRQGGKRSATATSARSRQVGAGAGEGEILVQGPRVLGGSPMVLAVDDTLRYTDRKAGYHGGGSPAEVVVPIVLLWPGAVPATTANSLSGEAEKPFGYVEAPSQSPDWWDHPLVGGPGRRPLPPRVPAVEPAQSTPAGQPKKPAQDSLTGRGSEIVSGAVWKAQRAIAGRITIENDRCAQLLDELLAAPGTRLATNSVAKILRIPDSRTQGAISQVQKLLNVEGYPVLRQDQGMLVLDPGLLEEQFGPS